MIKGYLALQNNMEKQYPQVELDISIGDDEIEAAMLEVLSLPELERVVQGTLYEADVTQPVSLTLLVTDDAAIQELNKRYRQQDKPTDVLSFPLLEKPIVSAPADQLWMPPDLLSGEEIQTQKAFVTPPDRTMHLGDIVISWPTVIRQASEVGHNPAYELLFLLSHGVLHLIGYDDQTEAGYQSMIGLQQAVMEALGQKA